MRVFVSHAGRDRAWAEWAAWQVEHAGWGAAVELDVWDWQAGDDFVARINTALETCDHMLALFSDAYFEPSRWTHREWSAAFRLAQDRPGFLVPVRIEDAPAPPLLATMIAPNIGGLPEQQARAVLLAALRPPGRPDSAPPLPHSKTAGQGDTGPRLPGVLPPLWGRVPARNEAFTGRDGLLLRLREDLQRTTRSVVRAVHGAGGVGKTQLAGEYAWRFAGDYDAVWWVDAEQPERIAEQYAGFAVAWGLVDPATQVGPAVETLRTHCRQHGRWLVVLDNAVHAAQIQPWRLDGPGHVLVTSRDPYWPEFAASVPVDVFTPAESTALLRAHLPNLGEDDAARLGEVLGFLPLALAQAAGLIAQTRMPVEEYLTLLDEAPGEVLDAGGPISYPGSLAKSLRVTLTHLASVDPGAAQLMGLCGFLAPEPIPTGWFPAAARVLPPPLANVVGSRLAYRRLLGGLSGLGLVRFIADDLFAVHRLTQHLLRADAADPADAAATVGRVLAHLSLGDLGDPGSWSGWADVLPHLRALDLAATDDEALARQACDAAWYLLHRGENSASHDMIAPLHAAWRDRLGPTANQTRWAAASLAHVLGALGRPREAVQLERELLDHYRAVAGEDHPDTLTAAANLAIGWTMLGDYAQALALAEDTFARRCRVLGADHPDTLFSANHLAGELAGSGEHARARALYEETLARRRRVLGVDHLETLRSAGNLAVVLAALGEHVQAGDLAEDAYTRSCRLLGDDHPDTLFAASNLAIQLAASGEQARARALDETTLTRRRRILGDDHPSTLISAEQLALWLADLGEHAQARALADDTLTRSRRTLGEDHPATRRAHRLIERLDRQDTPGPSAGP